MEYRQLGGTGMKASVIGFGGEHLDGKPYQDVKNTVDCALEQGINIIDMFMPGKEVRSNFGRALEGRRDQFIIQGHVGSCDINQQYDITRDPAVCRRYFEDLLKCLRTDYIDVGMMFFIDSEDDFNSMFHTEILTYVQKLKQQGTIRAIGASSHNPRMAQKVVQTGVVDLLLFAVNPAFDMFPSDADVLGNLEKSFEDSEFNGIQPDRLALYRMCEQQNVSITVMKTLGAGKLISPQHTPFAEPMTVQQCIHYALTRPAVASALLGFQSPEQVMEAVRYLDMSDEERDYSRIVGSMQNSFKGNCVYCSHCLPCPSAIDIAAVNKYLDIARLDLDNVPPSIRQHYTSMASAGGDCIQCGSCESRCPFEVPILDNMEEASRIFGK